MAKRPDHLKPPAYLSPSPSVPQPEERPSPSKKSAPVDEKQGRLEPTRYGDWEQNGIAVDF